MLFYKVTALWWFSKRRHEFKKQEKSFRIRWNDIFCSVHKIWILLKRKLEGGRWILPPSSIFCFNLIWDSYDHETWRGHSLPSKTFDGKTKNWSRSRHHTFSPDVSTFFQNFHFIIENIDFYKNIFCKLKTQHKRVIYTTKEAFYSNLMTLNMAKCVFFISSNSFYREFHNVTESLILSL